MINEVVLVGRVGKDPEFKQFENGCIAKLSLATTERAYKLQNGTEVPEKTEWHNIIVRNKIAEVARDYVKKGMLLGVSGNIHYREYEKDGDKRFVTEIQADRMQILSSKEKTEEKSNTPTSDTREQTVQDDLPF